MQPALEWIDHSHRSKYRIVYTDQELGIPGLRMFGKHTMNQACAPLAPHFHREAYEFTFVTEGAINFTVGDDDYGLSGYDIFMTKPNEVHSTNLLPLSAGEIIWFQLDVSDPGHFLFLNRQAAKDCIQRLSLLARHRFRPGRGRIFDSIKRSFALAAHPQQRYLASSCLLTALYEIMALPGSDGQAVTPDIERVLLYIREHLSGELPLEELAAICRLSVSQFKQKFRTQVGIAPRHYINYAKIGLAKQLLAQGKSVTDTAMELGFCNSSYFTVVFKRYAALTPTEYLGSLQAADRG